MYYNSERIRAPFSLLFGSSKSFGPAREDEEEEEEDNVGDEV